VRKPAIITNAPKKNSQNDSALSRGNDMSGAPICSGTTKLARPKANGVAKRYIIALPCIVKSWLYCWWVRYCRPGFASSARIASAKSPLRQKYKNAVRQ
jgi:hypothetical protein